MKVKTKKLALKRSNGCCHFQQFIFIFELLDHSFFLSSRAEFSFLKNVRLFVKFANLKFNSAPGSDSKPQNP